MQNAIPSVSFCNGWCCYHSGHMPAGCPGKVAGQDHARNEARQDDQVGKSKTASAVIRQLIQNQSGQDAGLELTVLKIPFPASVSAAS